MSERIVDVHIHPFGLLSDDQLLAEMDEAGVEVGILLALDTDPSDLDRSETRRTMVSRLREVYSFDLTEVIERTKDFLGMVQISDEEVASLVRMHPDRFEGFGSVDLSKDEAYVEEKIRAMERLPLRGIKLIPTLQFFNPEKSLEKLRRVFEHCEKARKIVLYHTGCDPYIWEEPHVSQDANPKHLRSVVSEFEKVPVIVAHMGCYSARMPGVWVDEALELGRENTNVWFDIAAVPYVVTREKFVDKIRKTVGFDRVLFGSDYPAVGGSGIQSMVTEVKGSDYMTNEEKAKVLRLNAAKLFGFH